MKNLIQSPTELDDPVARLRGMVREEIEQVISKEYGEKLLSPPGSGKTFFPNH